MLLWPYLWGGWVTLTLLALWWAHYQLKEKTMKTFEEFTAKFETVDAETNRLSDLVRDIKAQLEAGGLTAEQEQVLFDRLGGVADRLGQIGKDPENPVPPEENPVP